jgi:coenzyme F420-reducing hydrogenase alpha subunit
VERGLALKKAVNSIMERVGGRAIHPALARQPAGGLARVGHPAYGNKRHCSF